MEPGWSEVWGVAASDLVFSDSSICRSGSTLLQNEGGRGGGELTVRWEVARSQLVQEEGASG